MRVGQGGVGDLGIRNHNSGDETGDRGTNDLGTDMGRLT